MQRIESRAEKICRSCHFENEYEQRREHHGNLRCARCGASLHHDVLITYIDNCALCDKSLADANPMFFVVDNAGAHHWLCYDCLTSPRGKFVWEFELGQSTPLPAPPCQLCGRPATLLALTRAQPDGAPLCETCAETDTGKRWLVEHDEPPGPTDEEALLCALYSAGGIPFVELGGRYLVARADASRCIQHIYSSGYRLHSYDALKTLPNGERQFDIIVLEQTPPPTETTLQRDFHSHPSEITHYDFVLDDKPAPATPSK